MKATSRKKPKIEHGKIDLGPEYKDPANAKVKITIWLSGDTLKKLKERAILSHGGKYQTLINDILTRAIEGKPLDDWESRLQALEKAILKKK